MSKPLKNFSILSVTHLLFLPTRCSIFSFFFLSILVTPHMLRTNFISLLLPLTQSLHCIRHRWHQHSLNQLLLHIQTYTSDIAYHLHCTKSFRSSPALISTSSYRPPFPLKRLRQYLDQVTTSMVSPFMPTLAWSATLPLSTNINLLFATLTLNFNSHKLSDFSYQALKMFS